MKHRRDRIATPEARRANAGGDPWGWLRLRVLTVLPLAQAAEVRRLLENRQSIGKIALTTDEES